MNNSHYSLWDQRLPLLRKITASFLAASILMAPIGPLAAQTVDDASSSGASGASAPDGQGSSTPVPSDPTLTIPGVDTTTPPPDVAPSDTTPTIDSAASADQSVPSSDAATTPADTTTDKTPSTPLAPSSFGTDNLPTVQSPGVFTFQNTAPKADGQTGALIENIPLDIPPGRNGLQPDLALKYNSQNTEDSIVGYGWSLSIPYIQRLNKTGSQDLYNTYSYFTSSIDGELATTSSATSPYTYGAKVDDGHFNAYTFTNNVWTMYDKNGTRYTFGAADQAQQNASASSTQIYKWMLQEIRDTNNNYVRYIYTKDSGQIYPSQILYTGNGGADGIFAVNFTTASRNDKFTNYLPGFKVTTNSRISQITASVNGNVVREYNLSYTTGHNGYRSLLSSVQENGYDANHQNLVAYPALTLGYIASTTAFTWPVAAFGSGAASGHVIADVNGNAINDVAYMQMNGVSGAITGTIWQEGNTNSSAAVNPAPEYWSDTQASCDSPRPDERGTRFVDVNADGKADVVQSISGSTTRQLFLNTYSTSTNYGWLATSTYVGSLPTFAHFFAGGQRVTLGIFGDVNADGLPDFQLRVDSIGTSTWLGNGSAWDGSNAVFSSVFPMPWPTPTEYNSQLVDVNGDGLADWVATESGVTKVRLNTGTGWEVAADSTWTIATSTLFQSPDDATVFYDRGIRFLDINGDGLVDLVRSYEMDVPSSNTAPRGEVGTYQWVMLNTGAGWATSTAYTLPTYIAQAQLSGGTWTGGICHNEYANFTGNGQNAQDVLSTITYPQGGTATVTYRKTAQDGNNAELPISLLTVASIKTNDGIGPIVEKDYTYSGGQMYFGLGVRNRKFGGFLSSTENDLTTLTTTYYDQGNTINTALGEQNDGYGQINHPFRIDVAKTSNSQLLRQTFNRWDATTTWSGNTTFVNLARQVVQDYDAVGSSHRDSATDYAYSTSTGNVTQITRYGEVTGNSNGTFTDIGSDKSTETISYAVSTTTQVIGAPYDDSVVDQGAVKVRETRHTYDGLAGGSVSIANETKTENWITGSTYASTTKSYDGTYGLVTKQVDPMSASTTLIYDSNNLYVATSTNALSQKTGYTYDYSTGKVKTQFDPNSRLSSTAYDGFGRPLTISIPDPSSGALVTKSTYSYTDSSTPGSTSVTQTDYLGSATSSATYTYFDGLNRKLQSRRQFESSNYVINDWTYNNVGLLNTETLPYFASGSSRASATTSSPLFITYGYDSLQRVLTSTNTLGVTTNAYNTWTVTTTDPDSKIKDYVKDAYGNLVTVVEHISGSPATTTYTYDLNKNLTKITDSLSNIRSFTYDGLNRRLTAQDLHAAADGTFGTATSTYDLSGNMTQQADPKNQTVNYTYDGLNRVLTEDYTGSAGTEISYGYDNCADGVSRLCAATTTDAVVNLTYNANGGVASERKTIDSTAYTTSYVYDRQGNITDLTYPDASIVHYGYDSVGLLDTISRKAPNTSTYASAITELRYAPTGAISYKSFGNGVTSTYTYDANRLYRLASIFTIASSTIMGGGGASGALGLSQEPFSNIAMSSVPPVSLVAKAPDYSRTALVELVKPERLAVAGAGAPALVQPVQSVSVSTSPISDMLAGLPALSRANTKSTEIAKIGAVARTPRNGVDIEIESIDTTPGGIRVFAKAWDKNGQIGFGRDGSVDIERFLIYNPPILVADPNGPIVRSHTNSITGAQYTTTFREDPKEALLQTLEHIIAVKKLKFPASNIVAGKVGNTTSTFFPDANPETSSFDGIVWRTNSSGETWSTIRSGAGTASGDSSTDDQPIAIASGGTSGTWTTLKRGEFLFDTSPLPNGDSIDSATVSLYGGISVANVMSDALVGLYPVSPASNVSATSSDYGTFGTTMLSTTTYSFGTWNTAGYNNFALTATSGIAAVNVSGDTKIGEREAKYDVTGATPTWVSLQGMYFGTQTADFAGTAQDPELIVEHSATATSSRALQDINYVYDAVGNITKIADGSGTLAAKTAIFTYDDVHRLSSASTTDASSTPYSQTYTYNTIGDLTNKSDVGSYTYAGTNFANPHAATTIAGTTYTYDNNGNLTNAGTSRYAWDYRNRMASVFNGTATSTFGYDFQNQRVRKVSGTATTTYPNKYMNKVVSGTQATTTDYIYMGDSIIAEIESGTGTTGGGGSVSTSTIVLDATSTNITSTVTGTTTKTWTHTVTGTNPVIILTANIQQTVAGIGSIASASWNGGAFTKATSTRTNSMEAEVWYLVATTTGAKTMSVTVNGTTTTMRLAASSFTGVSTSSAFDLVKSNNGSSGNPSVSITPTTNTDVVVATVTKLGGGGGGSTSTSTPAYVQSKKDNSTGSATFTSAVTTGNLIVVGLTINNTTVPSNAISDNKGNTYTKVAEAINGSSLDHAAIFYAKNVTGGSSLTVTSSVIGTIGIHEYSGVATSSPFDKAASSTGLSTKPTSGNVTTGLGNELYFGTAWSGQDGDAWTAGSGYTIRENETNNATAERFASEDAVIAAASTTAARYSVPTSENWAAAIATFKPQVTTGSGGLSADATSSRTTLFKDSATSTFGGASYAIATTSGAIVDTYTTATSTDWVMATVALRPATSTSSGVGSTATTTRYFHADYLNSTNVTSDKYGNKIQTLDYYPYGSTRVSVSADTTNEKKQFIGQYADAESSLSYLNARYMDGARGQFLSEDPVFLGTPKQQVLTDPQSLNSYSYANGNPVSRSDPTGRLGLAAVLPIAYGIGELGLGATMELWGPPVAAGAAATVVVVGAYSVAQKYALLRSGGNSYPGPGIDYQTYKLATENASRLEPDPNGNWKGTAGALVATLFGIKWLTDNANGGTDGPTNSDWIYAIYKNSLGDASSPAKSRLGSKTAGSSDAAPKSAQGMTFSAPQSISSGGGYGTSGTVYTNYVPANTHTACGYLCK